MGQPAAYTAHVPNAKGYVDYSTTEHSTWATLIQRQLAAVESVACAEFLQGLDALQLPQDRIPQLPDINRRLKAATGWEVAAVPALIPFSEFFALLAARRFPAATFIRRPDELDYLQEPDIFHEIFGHVPMLMHPDFAEFTAHYGQLGLKAQPAERTYLARLYWFTVEFGLIQRPAGLQIYGGGILSSIGETQYALRRDQARHSPFDLDTVLRTPYRIDIMQPQYYLLDDFRALLDLTHIDLMAHVREAMSKPLLPALFSAGSPTGSTRSHMANDHY